MVYKSRYSIDIPKCSFGTYLFKSPTHDLGDKPQYIDAERPDTHFLTTNSFRLWSQRLAVGLRRAGLQDGDRVLIFSPNSFLYPVAFLGTSLAGGVFSGANPSYTPRELAYQWKDSGAKFVLCADIALDHGIEAAKIAGMKKDQLYVFNEDVYDGKSSGSTKGCRNWSELFAGPEESKSYQWDDLKGPGECEKTLVLNYSSGTTGFPKGVEISHLNDVANCMQMDRLASAHPEFDKRTTYWRMLCFVPLYHAMGQTVFIGRALVRRTPVYVMPKFDFLQMLKYIEKFRITELGLVPPIAVALTKHPAVKDHDLSCVEVIGCGAAPLGEDSSRQVEGVFENRMRLMQGYGMTEVTCASITASDTDPSLKIPSHSVGIPIPNVIAKVMDVSSEPYREVTKRGLEHRGEIWVSGPNIMKGYWNKPEATRDTLVKGSDDGQIWLRTGDVGYVDDQGYFFIVDRIKELIKVKANQVAPAELEDLLLEHPAVADAAVIGIPTDDGDERPRAYIQCQPGSEGKVSEKDIQDYVAEKVVRYKRLDGGVEFVEAIPKNPSGKILRKTLREQYKEKLTKNSKAKL